MDVVARSKTGPAPVLKDKRTIKANSATSVLAEQYNSCHALKTAAVMGSGAQVLGKP